MPAMASVFPQGYLKTAEISVTAYLKRPWFCDNVTGRKELLNIFYMRVNHMSRMHLSLSTEKNIDLHYSKLKCILPVHVSKCAADVQAFSFFLRFCIWHCTPVCLYHLEPVLMAASRRQRLQVPSFTSFLLLFTHTLMEVLSSIL